MKTCFFSLRIINLLSIKKYKDKIINNNFKKINTLLKTTKNNEKKMKN
jgi:hypothetical protein